MMIHDGLLGLTNETDTSTEYTNSMLFMVAVLMASSTEEQQEKMLSYITSKAAEIRAANTKETLDEH